MTIGDITDRSSLVVHMMLVRRCSYGVGSFRHISNSASEIVRQSFDQCLKIFLKNTIFFAAVLKAPNTRIVDVIFNITCAYMSGHFHLIALRGVSKNVRI